MLICIRIGTREAIGGQRRAKLNEICAVVQVIIRFIQVRKMSQQTVPQGLSVHHKAFDSKMAERIAKSIILAQWDADMSNLENRSIQHYGDWSSWRRSESLTHTIPVNDGSMPESFKHLIHHLRSSGIMTLEPNQANVYGYIPGQGIHQHLDHPERYDNEIVMISLAGTCTLRFTHDATGQVHDVKTMPGTVVVIRDDARYIWKHGIPKDSVKDDARLSLVFRRQIEPPADSHALPACIVATLFLFALSRLVCSSSHQ